MVALFAASSNANINPTAPASLPPDTRRAPGFPPQLAVEEEPVLKKAVTALRLVPTVIEQPAGNTAEEPDEKLTVGVPPPPPPLPALMDHAVVLYP
jgi:hypothetical protein